MNLLERNTHQNEHENYREKNFHDKAESMELETDDIIDIDMDEEEEQEEKESALKGLLRQSNTLTVILLSVILVLLLCIIVMLLFFTGKTSTEQESADALQQSITDYAYEQKQNDNLVSTPEVTVADSYQEPEIVTENPQITQEEAEEAVTEPVSETADKTAIVVDVEDENDVSYTKEFILNEMLPYFADNNLDAVWDLAHLKRYVKLSAALENTNQYYYIGDVDGEGKPDGTGLAIYENNSYYYGGWSHGVRSGDGRWYRFYIDKVGQPTTKKKYQAHSYSGQWADDLPNGEGAEHYDVDTTQLQVRERTLQNVVGNFTNGLYDGELYANTVDYTGNVEEWSGTAKNGVFDLWRDVSAIGECSVWQKRDDNTLYMDIMEEDNKNQGMRELLERNTKQ